MTTPDLDGLKTPLRNLGSAILLLRCVAEGADACISERSLNWYADKMTEDYDAAQKWFDAAYEAAKGSGPVAVS